MGAVGLAAGMVALATTTATAMTKLDAQARTLGMSARNLDNWRGAVSLAGGDADGFVASMVSMNEAFRNLKIGEVKTDFIQATGMSGANFAALQTMDNDTRLRTIWSSLEKVADKDKQQALIEKIFGSGGVELFSLLGAKGQTLAGNYNTAASLNPLTNADYKSAIEGDKAQRQITQSLEKQFQNIGINIEQAILPYLKSLADWLSKNQKTLDAFAEAIGNATSAVVGFFGWMFASNQKQEAQILGGDAQSKAFDDLLRIKGIKKGSLEESFTFLGPEWSNLSKAMADGDIYNEFTDRFKKQGVNSSSISAFQKYSQALDASGMGMAERYAKAQLLSENMRFITGSLHDPKINLTVNVDKNGNVSIADSDTGKVLQTVGKAGSVSQTVSGLK